MRRRIRHRYDLPKSAYDYQLAVVLFAGIAAVVLVGGVMLLAKLLATALVLVQP